MTMDLDSYQRYLLAHYVSKRVFTVISWGCAATDWTARVLNSHPEIFCLHTGNLRLQQLAYPALPRLDGVAYLRLVASLGAGYAVAGDVHGMDRRHLPELREAFGDALACAVLVRDPLPRVRSQMAVFDEFRGFSIWDLDPVTRLAEAAGVTLPPGDVRSRMFVHAANMLNAIVEEREVGPVFRTEDITSVPDRLAAFITTLTAGTVPLGREWLQGVIARPRTNRHHEGGEHEWTSWEIDVLRSVVRPEAWAAYVDLGYSRPSFV
jgi:hypothetical protein